MNDFTFDFQSLQYLNFSISSASINSSGELEIISTNGQTLNAGAVTGAAGNVKSFGAVGDGVTDDTAAIQAAINAMDAVGGALFIPKGTYIVSGLRLTGKSCAYVYGEGYGSILELKSGANADLLYCTWCDKAIFSRFRLDGNNAHNTVGNCIVLTDNCAYACIQEMEIQYAAEYGIKVLGEFDPANPTNYLYTDEVHVNQSFVRWNGKSGLNFDGVGGLIITNNEFEYNTEHGICSTLTGISGANGHIITGNNILSNLKCGLNLFTSSRVTISENVFCHNGNEGVYTQGGGQNWICNNQFEDNGQDGGNANIKACYQTDVWVINNLITNADPDVQTAYQGLQCYSAGTAYILGNSFTNHPGGSVYLNDTKTMSLFNQGFADSVPYQSAAINPATVSGNAISIALSGYIPGRIYCISLSGAITAACTVAVNGGTAYNLVDKTGTAVASLAANSVIQIYQASSTSVFQIV